MDARDGARRAARALRVVSGLLTRDLHRDPQYAGALGPALAGGISAGILWAAIGRFFTAVRAVFVAPDGGLRRLRDHHRSAGVDLFQLDHPAARRARFRSTRRTRATCASAARTASVLRRYRAARARHHVPDRRALPRRRRARSRSRRWRPHWAIPALRSRACAARWRLRAFWRRRRTTRCCRGAISRRFRVVAILHGGARAQQRPDPHHHRDPAAGAAVLRRARGRLAAALRRH